MKQIRFVSGSNLFHVKHRFDSGTIRMFRAAGGSRRAGDRDATDLTADEGPIGDREARVMWTADATTWW